MIFLLKKIYIIADAKYENADLNKVVKNQYQHLTEMQRNAFLELLQILKSFYGTLGFWNLDTVYFKLRRTQI